MTAAGWDQQVGYGIESTFGTFVPPTRAIEHVKSNMRSVRQDIISKGVKAGRRTGFRRMKGLEVVGGTIAHELSPVNIGVLLVQAMGAVSTTGAGPYTHTITPGPLVETRSLSVQVGTPDYAGTVQPFNFSGCQVKSATITVKAGEIAMIEIDWVGQHLQNTGDGDTVAGLTAAVYSATWAPFTSLNAALSIAGSAYEFDEVTIKIDNGLRTGNYTSKATNPARANRAKEEGLRSITATVKSDLWDLTAMNRAFAGTEVAFSLALTNSPHSLTFAGNCRTLPQSPELQDGKITKDTLALDLLSATSDAAAFTATLVNADSTP